MNKSWASVGALVLATALSGCGHHPPPPAVPPVPAPAPAPMQAVRPAPATPDKAVVYTLDNQHGTDSDNYLVPHKVALPHRQRPERAALNALLAAPGTPIPAGTRLNSLKIADGLATLDFSRPPLDETHGEGKQTQALEAIQRTLGQFPDITRLQINVNGRPATRGEEGDSGPMDVIRPGEKPPEAGGV